MSPYEQTTEINHHKHSIFVDYVNNNNKVTDNESKFKEENEF